MSETEHELTETEPSKVQFEQPETDSDEEEAADSEETPEAEPESEGPSPEQIEQAFKKVDTAHKAYARKIGDAFGDEATHLIPCPVCADTIPGFVDERAIGQFPDDVRRQVMRFLGFASEQAYDPSAMHRTCGGCSGKGKVTTGSAVPKHETITCPACKGYGYVPPPSRGSNGNGDQAIIPASPDPLTPVMEQEDVDEWGEGLILPDGRENPNYGRMPHRKVLVEPYGVTAHLRAEPVYVPVEGEVVG